MNKRTEPGKARTTQLPRRMGCSIAIVFPVLFVCWTWPQIADLLKDFFGPKSAISTLYNDAGGYERKFSTIHTIIVNGTSIEAWITCSPQFINKALITHHTQEIKGQHSDKTYHITYYSQPDKTKEHLIAKARISPDAPSKYWWPGTPLDNEFKE